MCPATYKRLVKWARKGGLKGALNVVRTGITKKRKGRKASKRKAPKRKASKRKGGKKRLSPGVHWVKLKGGKKRKVRVLRNGQWRFMKG